MNTCIYARNGLAARRSSAGYSLSVLGAAMGLVLAQAAAAGNWDSCRYSDDREASFKLPASGTVSVLAGPGALVVEGTRGQREVLVRGRACADDKDDLAEIQIASRARGDDLEIMAEIGRRDYEIRGSLDLEISVPSDQHLDIMDSSGSMEVREVASLRVSDSSGSMKLRGIPGEVHIVQDSSGEIDVRDVGALRIDTDGSGGINVDRAVSVRIDQDSSGGIEIRHVDNDVEIGVDSSGSISVSDVGGNFSVRADSSGSIHHRRVGGSVDVPEYKRDHY